MPTRKAMFRAALCLPLLLLMAATAQAGDPCPTLRAQAASPDPATRIAAVACHEHLLWYRPFIDKAGRLASSPVAEAESRALSDGHDLAWQRVARYWRESGLLRQAFHRSGAQECLVAADTGLASAACRSFVLDTAWSAAFVSWVMRQAALPGFDRSASHVRYVRDALLRPDTSAYRFTDPAVTAPAVGDLLCHVRHNDRSYGHEGLRAAASGRDGLDMHCDVVVAVNPDNDSTAYLVGGNVQHSVTMRMLPLNRNGLFWGLPQRVGGQLACAPDNEAACNFNRQDWAVLLQLKPAAELARLPGPGTPVDAMQAEPADAMQAEPVQQQQRCCVYCVVGAGVPRCPAEPVTPPAP